MKLIIFDLGGVFYSDADVTPKISVELGIERGLFLEYAIRSGLNELSCGLITANDFWHRFEKVSGMHVSEELWGKLFNPSINEDVHNLIINLRKRYRVVAGTNTIAPHYEIMLERGDLTVFDCVYASNIIGNAKPDQEFFRKILNAEKIAPNEAVFIDDTEVNVRSADGLGIKAIHFRDGIELDRLLNRLIG
ncbi:hypothetical protein IX53_02240 [Kosmotoga pacifica]|uniref:Haloacid dehalogenase n=1 Tax=Kosmotoga pacifica TaxID=1330330 RepID=A0A0G2ZHC0_9BACT|nr:hypothetical protein IX53_02240 [Kosmotoga pacifica]